MSSPVENVFALIDVSSISSHVMSLAGVAILIVLVAFALSVVDKILRADEKVIREWNRTHKNDRY